MPPFAFAQYGPVDEQARLSSRATICLAFVTIVAEHTDSPDEVSAWSSGEHAQFPETARQQR